MLNLKLTSVKVLFRGYSITDSALLDEPSLDKKNIIVKFKTWLSVSRRWGLLPIWISVASNIELGKAANVSNSNDVNSEITEEIDNAVGSGT